MASFGIVPSIPGFEVGFVHAEFFFGERVAGPFRAAS
ncbi:hypothetical protein STVIR_8045 [Streptomyces viridochromogenes Tue57]|uniref:Uncharacterized protein n=1 Tax=Streptomyces viridochromogenes Tue57 TaxID=1160705 RepID=L8P3B0_STRVR|nr:hypothetical protein STVIR_8045 [Streptomyces viridochromogenes Tue57]